MHSIGENIDWHRRSFDIVFEKHRMVFQKTAYSALRAEAAWEGDSWNQDVASTYHPLPCIRHLTTSRQPYYVWLHVDK